MSSTWCCNFIFLIKGIQYWRDGSKCSAYTNYSTLFFITPQRSNCFFSKSIQVFIMDVSWNISSSASMNIYKSTLYTLGSKGWWKNIVMKKKNVECFFDIILLTGVMDYWKHIPPAPQYFFSITFLYSITKLKRNKPIICSSTAYY